MTLTSESATNKGGKTITDRYGLGRAPIPVDVNLSVADFEAEREKVFRRAWHLVGRVEDVAAPGQFFIQDIPTLKTSLIIIRGRDGKIRGFHNMCKHRGNRVVYPDTQRGIAKGFSCGFHGWTYDTAGKLVIVPDEDQFYDLDKSKNGLTPIQCEEWEGFIFINTNAMPEWTLKEWLGEMYDQFEGFFKDYYMFTHYASDIDCNWKIILDAFAEGYHVPFIHGKTLPEAITGEMNPLCHLQNIELYKWHRKLSAYGNPDYKPTPLETKLAGFIGAPVFPAMKADLEKLPAGVNPTRSPMWGFDLNIIFPVSYFAPWANGMLLIYHFWPTAVDKTRWEVKLYWDKPETAADRINLEMTRAMGLAVVREDMSSLETTQEVYNSGAISHIHLSDQEAGVRHNYKIVEEFIR